MEKERFKFSEYHEWLDELRKDPMNTGLRGAGLILATVPATLTMLLISLSFLPEMRYPRILLIIIGLIPGMIFLYLFGLVVYNLKASTSFILSCFVALVTLVAFIFLLQIIMSA
ncbi:MAG: hypothetical protein JNN15_19200 [Blastocatellia bacterium]|nr:hypothetical protein [Blastocatellia bacterium]